MDTLRERLGGAAPCTEVEESTMPASHGIENDAAKEGALRVQLLSSTHSESDPAAANVLPVPQPYRRPAETLKNSFHLQSEF